jgi:DNA-binding NarL/FixJ family response regulator
MNKPIRVLIVDDDKMVRTSFEIILGSDTSIEVISTAASVREALEILRTIDVDIVLMDIQMPETDGISGVRSMRNMYPHIKIIMLTTFKDILNIQRSLQAGASGFLLKTENTDKQIQAIKSVAAGLPVISESALKQFSNHEEINTLTRRENEIVYHLANGCSNKEIADRLCISEGTVRNNVSVILEKLNMRDRTQLAIFYWQHIH